MLKRKEEIIKEKIKQFKNLDININEEDLLKFLSSFYFIHNQETNDNLEKFLAEDNVEDIISFLMSDAIINPKF